MPPNDGVDVGEEEGVDDEGDVGDELGAGDVRVGEAAGARWQWSRCPTYMYCHGPRDVGRWIERTKSERTGVG